MTPETVVEVMRHALLTAFWLAAPLLAIGFLAGIAISLVQIATSIQDNAVSSVPRLVAFLAGTYCRHLLATLPVTSKLGAWYAGGGLVAMVVVLGLAVFGFWTALGNRAALGKGSLGDQGSQN